MRDTALTWLANFIWRRPGAVLVIAAVLAIISAIYAGARLRLNADTNDLISPNRPFMKEFRAFMREFGDTEYIYVIVADDGDTARTRAAVDALTQRLRTIDDLPGVHSAVTVEEQLRLASRAMPDDELANLSQASGAFASLGSAATALHEANRLLKELVSRGASMTEQEQQRTGAAAVFLLKAIAAADRESASGNELKFLRGEGEPIYFASDTGRLYFITIIPAKDYSTLSVIEKPLQQIRAVIDEVRREFPGVAMGLTGKPVLQADEMLTTNHDMTLASAVAFGLCAALFMIMIGGVWKPLLAVLAFAIGSAWTYGVVTLTLGQLNLLSIVFMLVLIGVGLDYGVHVISRYREFRRTHEARESVLGAVRTAVRGNITGALTSSTVFFMALFTTFQGLRELGFVAGVGLLLCLLAMATVLPALLTLSDRRRPAPTGGVPTSEVELRGVWHFMTTWPRATLAAAAIITVAFVFAPGSLNFEYNLLKLQAEGLESVDWEHRVVADSASNTWYGVAIADTMEQVRELTEKARQQPTIGSVRSVLDLVQPDSPARDEWRSALRLGLSPTNAPSPPASQPDSWTIDDLRRPLPTLQLLAAAARGRAPQEAEQLSQLRSELDALTIEMERDGQGVRQRVDQTVARIHQSIEAILADDQLPLRETLPDGLRQEYMAPTGRFLVMMHPKDDVWEYEPMRRFVNDIRNVDPQATGVPITHFESLGEMRHSFIVMSVLALATILVILWLDFRRVRDVLLALMPLAMGLVWTIEAMGLLGISFNLANFFSVPILIGLGVDSSVHILHRYHEGGPTRFSLGSTRRAVILTALTTIIGFGCLLLAHHRGLRSLGIVMAMGSTACLLSSVILLPAALKWLEGKSKSPQVQTSK